MWVRLPAPKGNHFVNLAAVTEAHVGPKQVQLDWCDGATTSVFDGQDAKTIAAALNALAVIDAHNIAGNLAAKARAA